MYLLPLDSLHILCLAPLLASLCVVFVCLLYGTGLFHQSCCLALLETIFRLTYCCDATIFNSSRKSSRPKTLRQRYQTLKIQLGRLMAKLCKESGIAKSGRAKLTQQEK